MSPSSVAPCDLVATSLSAHSADDKGCVAAQPGLITLALIERNAIQQLASALAIHDDALLRPPEGDNHAALAGTIECLQQRLHNGPGWAVLRGFPIEEVPLADTAARFAQFGHRFGRLARQNPAGDLVGQVRDRAKDFRSNGSHKGVDSHGDLPFHSDLCDVMLLLCMRSALRGGVNSVADCVAMEQALRLEEPLVHATLFQPFAVDRLDEQLPNELPYRLAPVFASRNGRLFVRYSPGYVLSAQRHIETPRLQPAQRHALEVFQAYCWSDRFRVDIDLEPGDVLFLNNNVTVHARSAFEDSPGDDFGRLLLRLWVYLSHPENVPLEFRDKYVLAEA